MLTACCRLSGVCASAVEANREAAATYKAILLRIVFRPIKAAFNLA
jgi:hypothetical protein